MRISDWSSDVCSSDLEWGSEDRQEQGTQECFQPADEEAEVVAGGGEDGVGVVAVAALEIVALHAVLGLDVADDGLDSGAPFQLAADGLGDPAHLTSQPICRMTPTPRPNRKRTVEGQGGWERERTGGPPK